MIFHYNNQNLPQTLVKLLYNIHGMNLHIHFHIHIHGHCILPRATHVLFVLLSLSPCAAAITHVDNTLLFPVLLVVHLSL